MGALIVKAFVFSSLFASTLFISPTRSEAATLTFDQGSTITGGYIEDGITVTGGLRLGDANGDRSNDLTRFPNDPPITILSAKPFNFISFDLLGTSIATEGFNRMYFYSSGSTGAPFLGFSSNTSGPGSVVHQTFLLDSRGYETIVWDYDHLNPPNAVTTIDNLTFSWVTIPPVPEPNAAFLFFSGLVLLSYMRLLKS
jgi:hypothetical protein